MFLEVQNKRIFFPADDLPRSIKPIQNRKQEMHQTDPVRSLHYHASLQDMIRQKGESKSSLALSGNSL